MIGHLRIKSPWSQLALFLGLMGGGFVLASLSMALVITSRGLPMAGLNQLDWSQPNVLSTMKLVQALSSIIIFMLPALAFALIVFRGRPFYFLGLRPPVKAPMYGLAMLCILVSMPFVFWLGELNQLVNLPDWMVKLENETNRQMAQLLKASGPADIAVNVLVIALLPALCEEICFRGVLQRIIINICRNPWVGIIVTSALFSALHLQFQGFLPRMFLGMILGALYWYSGSLWTSILAHFINNAVQVVAVSYAPQYMDKNPSMPLLAALASGVLVMVILWVYRSFSTITYSKVYEYETLHSGNEFLA